MTATTIKVEFDPTQEFGQRYLGSDEDGPRYEPMSLQEAVVERAAEMLVSNVDKQVAAHLDKRIHDKLNELLDERLPALVEEALTREAVVTDVWGSERRRGSLRDLMVKHAEEQLTFKESRYGDQTVVAKVVKEQIDYMLSRELTGAVQKAKADLVKRLEVKAAEVIAESVTDGLR